MEKVDFGPLVQNMECVIAWAELHGSRGHGGGLCFLMDRSRERRDTKRARVT